MKANNEFKKQEADYRNINSSDFSGIIGNIIFQKNNVIRINRLSYRKKKKQK